MIIGKFHILSLLVVFIIGNFLLLPRYQSLKNIQPPIYDAAILREPFHEYVLSPKYIPYIFVNADIPYLYVSKKTSDPTYFTVDLHDRFNLNNKINDPLFLASKRISELEHYGNDTIVLGNYKNFNELNRWWNESKPTIWRREFINYNSWEATIARYQEMIDLEVKTIEKQNDPVEKIRKLNSLRNFIEAHKEKVDVAIYNFNRGESQKKYLHRFTTNFFQHYINYINRNLPVYDPKKITFSLDDVIREHEEGLYEVRVDSPNNLELINKDLKLHFNNANYTPARTIQTTSEDNFVLLIPVFKTLEITNSTKEFTLEIPNLNVTKDRKWQRDSTFNGYRYYIEASLEEPQEKYYVKFSYQFSGPVLFQYEALSSASEFNPKTKMYDRVNKNFNLMQKKLLPSIDVKEFKRHIGFYNQRSNLLTRFVITSDFALPQEELDKSVVELTPVIEPEVRLEKTGFIKEKKPYLRYQRIRDNVFNIELHDISENKKTAIVQSFGYSWYIADYGNNLRVLYWPALFLGVGIVFFNIVTLSLFIIRLPSSTRDFIKRPILYLYKQHIFPILSSLYRLCTAVLIRTYRYFYRYKFALFVVATYLFFYHIFFLDRQSNGILLPIVILLMGLNISYNIEKRILFLIALILMTLLTLLYIVKAELLSEKLAIWTYILLSLGVIQFLWEEKRKSNQLTSLYTVTDAIIKDAHTFWDNVPPQLRIFIILIGSNTKIIVIKIYGTKPTKFVQQVTLAIKLFATLMVMGLLVFIGLIININLTRLSMDPQIIKIEPTIVYPSIKVIINGRNFGWKEGENVKLKLKEEEVYTDLWTESKIIFTVPLHWKDGNVKLVIEKPILWNGKRITAKSKEIHLKLLPRHGKSFTPDDDEYFEQLEYLDYETLEINGYIQKENE